MRRDHQLASMSINFTMEHYDQGFDQMGHVLDIWLHRDMHVLDSQIGRGGIVDHVADTMDQLQLQHVHTMIHLLLQSRGYLL